jgi:hypothetical protein
MSGRPLPARRSDAIIASRLKLDQHCGCLGTTVPLHEQYYATLMVESELGEASSWLEEAFHQRFYVSSASFKGLS